MRPTLIENIVFIVKYVFLILNLNPLYRIIQIIKQLNLMDQPYDLEKQGYMHQSKLTFQFAGTTSYEALLKKYDRQLLQLIRSHNEGFLGQTVYLINAQLQPQNLKWMIWKNSDEVLSFINNFETEINRMLSTHARSQQSGVTVLKKYQELLKKNIYQLDQNTIRQFIEFLNCVAAQPFLYKSDEFLLFIEHCISVDKWHIKVFQQVTVDKAPSLSRTIGKTLTKPCSGDPQNRSAADRGSLDRDYFITITSDGILKSQNHLMESVIQSMIPFTNRFQKTQNITASPESYLSFGIKSCSHQKIDIHFYKDYAKGVNFSIGLNMALSECGYADEHRFESFATVRQNCAIKLYNDGKGYYSDLYDQLMKATKQICITGWMITPYFLLKRPNKITDKACRLDGVLQSLAERGLKIFIIAFKEPKMFVNNDSEHVESYLQSLHRNITVLRHPDNMIPLLWSHHEKMVIIDQKIGFMGGLDICYGRWDDPEHRLQDPGDLWDGCDYNNYRTMDIYQPRNYKQSNLNPNFQPRMPWHDIALQFRGDVVLDLLRHFVQYWYFVKWDEEFTMKQMLGLLSSKFTPGNKTQQLEREGFKTYMQNNPKDFKDKIKEKKRQLQEKRKHMSQERNDETMPQLFIETKRGRKAGHLILQMCRSASSWSIGIPSGQQESSIHNAYQDLIENSENFIYIENQFFMGLENKIVECLSNRIMKAHRQNQPFKVIVVLPLLPGFEGDIADPASSVLRIQVYHQYNAICRQENSLYKRLSSIVNIDDYIYFFGLRTANIVKNVPMTEIIYVHSKLMIVDDKRGICGSANINDRSLLGSRDSELACVIQDIEGNLFDLRARIFQEHFGLTREESFNVTNPQIWLKIIENSKRNTAIYRTIFGCIPDDNITIVGQINKLSGESDILKYHELKDKIKGHAVDYPLKFLEDEDLSFKPNQKEYFAPVQSFT